MLFKITLLSSFVPFPLFYVNNVLNKVIYFPVLQDYYIFSFDFHIFLKLHDTFVGLVTKRFFEVSRINFNNENWRIGTAVWSAAEAR
jgi:hypothetical protein